MLNLSDEARYAIKKMQDLGVTHNANLGILKKSDDPAVIELRKHDLIEAKEIPFSDGEVMVRLNANGIKEYEETKAAGVYSQEWEQHVTMILSNRGGSSLLN